MTGCLVIDAAPRTSRFPVPAFPSHAAGCRVFLRGIRRHAPYVPSFPGFLGRHCVGYRGLLRFPKASSARGVVGGYYRIMLLSFSDEAKRLHRQKGCAERARGRIRPWGKSLRSARLIRALISRGFLSCWVQKAAPIPPKTSPHFARHNTHYVSLPQGLMRPGTQKKGIKLTFYSASRSWPCASLPGGAAVARFSARAAPRAPHVQTAGFSLGVPRCSDFCTASALPAFWERTGPRRPRLF
jgi:hypothetical protein